MTDFPFDFFVSPRSADFVAWSAAASNLCFVIAADFLHPISPPSSIFASVSVVLALSGVAKWKKTFYGFASESMAVVMHKGEILLQWPS